MADFAIVRVCYEIFMTFVEQGFVLRVRKVEKGVVMFFFFRQKSKRQFERDWKNNIYQKNRVCRHKFNVYRN